MTTIHGRAAWGARYAAGFGPAPLPATSVWLHHSVTETLPASASFVVEAAAMRYLEEIGERRFGGGISYTFVVFPSGRVFEGHGVGREGAHTRGLNDTGRAVLFAGNYEEYRPTDQQIDAAGDLLAHGHGAGWWTAPRLTGGHRDAPGAATACPGRWADAAIPAINSRAVRGPIDQEESDVELSDRLPDYYAPNLPPLTVADTLSWGTAHAAHARDAARAARDLGRLVRTDLAAVHSKLDGIRDDLDDGAAAVPLDYRQLALALLGVLQERAEGAA